MSKDRIYLRPSFNDDGTFAGLVDQDDRRVFGVIDCEINAPRGEAITFNIYCYASSKQGQVIATNDKPSQ